MKKGIHPENYRPVVFKDMSNGDCFLSRSTCATKEIQDKRFGCRLRTFIFIYIIKNDTKGV